MSYTYETRRDLTKKWVAFAKAKADKKKFDEIATKMLPDVSAYYIPQTAVKKMRELLQNGTYGTLSELYRGEFPAVVEACVPKEMQDEFYYALDEMNCYQMTRGWYRRSVRSGSYEPFVEKSVRLVRAFSKLEFYGGDLADILTGNVDPEIYDHARCEVFDYDAILAAQIDRGNRKIVEALKDILLGEGNTAMISHEMIRGIVMSKSEELYELLGKFLLAARLQEGARQAVCETMDAGRPEAFLHLFSVIEENNLVRYSSVKRAVSTWIGIFNENSMDRITDKLMRLMGQCVRDGAFCEEQLATNDSVAISCALWAKGFYDADDAIEAMQQLIRTGTKNQKMTASYFNASLQRPELKNQAAMQVIKEYPDQMELVACFMPAFMSGAGAMFYSLLEKEDGGYFSIYDKEVRKPKIIGTEEMFESRDEARQMYDLLKGILEQVPKKGFVKDPCIFPWYRVSMSRSDLVVRMCLIAYMLQEEKLLDEAAELIPQAGQGENSYYSSRSAITRVLLYRPKSEIRKKVLFSLLHNPEENTLSTAQNLVKDMELLPEDYIEIEQNLKYKKGRSGTLEILKKQDTGQIAGCIDRLIKTSSEECHMGALDLALWLKQKDGKIFETVKESLAKLKNPTGKEQVLLDELTGTSSEAQDILKKPGYGFYDVEKKFLLPPAEVDVTEAERLFGYQEKDYLRIFKRLDELIYENREKAYVTNWQEDMILGNKLERSRLIYDDPDATPLDAYPFREIWEEFYQKEIKSPELLLETYFYRQCVSQRNHYTKNTGLYQKIFGSSQPFVNLRLDIDYNSQVNTVINVLFEQYVPDSLMSHWALPAVARLLSLLDEKNDLYFYTERYWGDREQTYSKRATELPIFNELRGWLSKVEDADWGTSFTIRFGLQEYYDKQKGREKSRYSYSGGNNFLYLKDFVECFVRGYWDKDMVYKAVFRFLNIDALFGPVSAVEQIGPLSLRNAYMSDVNRFFGNDVIRPADGKYSFDAIGDEMPAMKLAHEIYREIIPSVLKVELKRGEQPTPFSSGIHSIHVVYGIDYMIQILTALGKDTLQRGYSYYSSNEERKSVLSHLLKICRPKPQESVKDLKAALKGADITKKRLVELAMYADQWIPMLEEYLELPGFASGCYYFMAHTSEAFDEYTTSMIAKYTPLSPEELHDGAFDINWFFEAYNRLGEKDFKLLYDAAKYSSTGTAHGRARKYANAALGQVELSALKEEIDSKRNKDLLMSIGLLPLSKKRKERDADLFDRYQYIQKFKIESRQFGAQRRASEGRAVEIALQNLSVNAGFNDVTRLVLRMENRLVELSAPYFDWNAVGEIELLIAVDENGKSTIRCRKDEKILKSIPAKYKKHETVLDFQQMNKKLKEQYSRTKQMMEQAMEDGTTFEVWEFLELAKNPVVSPIVKPLVVMKYDSAFDTARERIPQEDAAAKKSSKKAKRGGSEKEDGKNVAMEKNDSKIVVLREESLQRARTRCMGFLTEEGIVDWKGDITPVKPQDTILIAHPFDLLQSGHWQDYQKLLFEKQLKQPFKQVFRELYVKLNEELKQEKSLMFSGNQIQPQRTVGALRSRRWVADYDDGLQKVYYRENIVARIYAMADWFTPSDVEAPTLDWVVFSDRKTGAWLKIEEIPDIIYSEVMRDVDLAVSVAHAGGVDPETSHSTIEMRSAIVACNLELFKIKNVRLEKNHAYIDGKLGQYTIHLGSGVVHQQGNAMLYVIPVHSQHRGRIFLPFVDDDPKTAEIMSKILLFAEDNKIKDPNILSQIH